MLPVTLLNGDKTSVRRICMNPDRSDRAIHRPPWMPMSEKRQWSRVSRRNSGMIGAVLHEHGSENCITSSGWRQVLYSALSRAQKKAQ